MAKNFITAHVKLEDTTWKYLTDHAAADDLTTAQLVRRVLLGWLESQAFVQVGSEGPVTAQEAGTPEGAGYVPETARRARLMALAQRTLPTQF